MKHTDYKTHDTKLKNIFGKIETDIPNNNFTALIMQRIAVEKIEIAPKDNKLNWLLYSAPFFAVFILIVAFLPAITRWVESISFDIPSEYLTYLKNAGESLLVSIKSIDISPVILVIIGSCSILLSILGLSNVGEKSNLKHPISRAN